MKLVAAASLLLLVIALPAQAQAAPSCKKHYEPGSPGEKLLRCTYRGGARPTRQLGGKHFIGVVGTCWDYDVVSLKKCGCRLFEKASLCCGKGRASRTCHWRVGGSRRVDCKKFKQPRYGLSGNEESAACRQELNAADCFRKVSKQALVSAGPCEQLRADCKDHEKAGSDFFNMKCGPLIEDCGCTVDRVCSPAEAVKCYDEYSKDKEVIACYWQKNTSQYDMKQCHEALKRKRAGK